MLIVDSLVGKEQTYTISNMIIQPPPYAIHGKREQKLVSVEPWRILDQSKAYDSLPLLLEIVLKVVSFRLVFQRLERCNKYRHLSELLHIAQSVHPGDLLSLVLYIPAFDPLLQKLKQLRVSLSNWDADRYLWSGDGRLDFKGTSLRVCVWAPGE